MNRRELLVSKLRGHEIEKRYDGQYVYSDTGELTAENWGNRPCGVCKRVFTSEGHDPCLGRLPGVMNACCGHGEPGKAYIQYDDGKIISGMEAVREATKLVKG